MYICIFILKDINTTSSVPIVILVCLFSEQAIWNWIANWFALPWGSLFLLLSGFLSFLKFLYRTEALWTFFYVHYLVYYWSSCSVILVKLFGCDFLHSKWQSRCKLPNPLFHINLSVLHSPMFSLPQVWEFYRYFCWNWAAWAAQLCILTRFLFFPFLCYFLFACLRYIQSTQ